MEVNGTRLRRLREDRLLTQPELAARAGMTKMTVSRLERGLGVARISTVRKLAEALGVPAAELLARRPGEEQGR